MLLLQSLVLKALTTTFICELYSLALLEELKKMLATFLVSVTKHPTETI